MKYNILLPLLGLTTLSFSSLYAAPSAEALFDAKCAVCHVKVRPNDTSTLIAPPAMGVMRHVKMQYSTKEDALAFMQSYVMKPVRNRAVCSPQSIKRFGIMPSQKGVLTEEELRLISSWMYENITLPNNMMQKNGQRQQNSKQCQQQKNRPQSSPFLISSGLPHMTKMIKINWDNPDLALNLEQKKKLLVVRKTTLTGVKSLKPQIMQLEKQIKKMTMSGQSVTQINSRVDALALLKAKISKVHINCIHESKNILTQKQVKFLLGR